MFNIVREYFKISVGKYFILFLFFVSFFSVNGIFSVVVDKIDKIGIILSGFIGLILFLFSLLQSKTYIEIFGDYDNYKLVKEKFSELYRGVSSILLFVSLGVNLFLIILFYKEISSLRYSPIIVIVFCWILEDVFFVEMLWDICNTHKFQMSLRKFVGKIKVKFCLIFFFSELYMVYVIMLMKYLPPIFSFMIYVGLVLLCYVVYGVIFLHLLIAGRVSFKEKNRYRWLIKEMRLTKYILISRNFWRFYNNFFVKDLKELFKKS